MVTRFTHLLVLLAALLLPLCCCKIGGWESVIGVGRTASHAEPPCPLCDPATKSEPAPEGPCDQCPSCKGWTGTLPDAPATLTLGTVWELPVAVLAPVLWPTPETTWATPLQGPARVLYAGGRDLLRRQCALLL